MVTVLLNENTKRYPKARLGLLINFRSSYHSIVIKIEILYLIIKVYGVQNRTYCGVSHTSGLPENNPNHLQSKGHGNNVLRNQCSNSMIIKTPYKKR